MILVHVQQHRKATKKNEKKLAFVNKKAGNSLKKETPSVKKIKSINKEPEVIALLERKNKISTQQDAE